MELRRVYHQRTASSNTTSVSDRCISHIANRRTECIRCKVTARLSLHDSLPYTSRSLTHWLTDLLGINQEDTGLLFYLSSLCIFPLHAANRPTEISMSSCAPTEERKTGHDTVDVYFDYTTRDPTNELY